MKRSVVRGSVGTASGGRDPDPHNLLNPKGALFVLGVFTQVIGPETSRADAGMLVLAMITTSTLFWLAYVTALYRPPVRRFVEGRKRAIERVFGALLVGVGLRVAVQD